MAPDNGTAGSSFTFNLSSITTGAQQSVTVSGGTCSSSLPVDAGKWLINEDLSSGLWGMTGVTTQPAANLLAEKDSIGQAKVSTPSGADTAVTFTNQPAQATLKVCQWSRTPQYQGSQFSFTINQSTVTAVAGSSASTAGCSAALPFQPGSKVQVVESVPTIGNASGATIAKVADVRVGGSATLSGWKSPQAKVTVGIGVNTITFEDEPLSPPQTGYVEICKGAGDEFISSTTPFAFTVTDRTNVSQTEQVFAGQCSGPISVLAGNVGIAETPTPNTQVSGISTLPDPAALGATNLANGTATVVVPVSASTSGEVMVTYVNSTITEPLKVCKFLAAGSTMLAGQTFTFNVTGSAGETFTVPVVASASPNGSCRNVTYAYANFPLGGRSPSASAQFPLGSTVSVTESLASYPNVSGDGNPPGQDDTQQGTIVAGINSIDFTNQALGQLQICKYLQTGDDVLFQNNEPVFGFTVTGVSGTVQVAASKCSQSILVPAGTVTVTESSTPGFGFVSSTASGPSGDNRATSGTAANGLDPITVTVPWFDDPNGGGLTTVDFVNKVYRVQLKICTVIAPGSTGSLGNTTFSYQISVNGSFVPGGFVSQPPYPSCSGLMLNVPIIDPATGKAASIKVKETNYTPTSMTVQNTAASPPVQTGAAYIQFAPGVGNDVVTFTNS